MAESSQRQHDALKNVLFIFLPILNVIQLYIIVTTNSNSNSVTNVLWTYLPVQSLFEGWKRLHESDSTPKLLPRPESEINIENVSVKWSRSADRLQYLASHETSLYQLMKEYKLEIQAKLDLIDGWIQDYESTSANAKSNEEIASHPFLATAMLRRFSALNPLKSTMSRAFTEQEIEARMKEMENTTRQALPNITDYEDAIWNIIYLRYVYDLSVIDLMNGKLKDIQTRIGLTPDRAYEIALVAEKKSAYSEAFYWYDTLLDTVTNEDPSENRSRVTIAQIETDIDRIRAKHDELLDRITDANYWEYHHRFVTKMDSTPKEELRTPKQTIIEEGWQDEYPNILYHDICAGQSYLTDLELARLTCFYDKKSDPHWLLSPLKVEVYSWDPYLIRIYDVISESMTEYLLSSSRGLMEEAEVVNHEYNNTQESVGEENSTSQASQVPFASPSKARVGLTTFLQAKSTHLKVLYQRISSMTGLKCEYSEHYPTDQNPLSAEDIQIGSYAFGGHYEFHRDFFPEDRNLTSSVEGNRLATFMIYLNDVTSGGHTAFPVIGLSVKPIRNSAVFWYNLHRNGTGDGRTLHGGCPVILGHKWIANVWILSFASFLERKCSLNPHE